jgi:hypothetical protein
MSYARKIGLGSMDYELVNCEQEMFLHIHITKNGQ